MVVRVWHGTTPDGYALLIERDESGCWIVTVASVGRSRNAALEVPAAMSFASKTRGWIVCNTQATAGYQGKAVGMTTDGGTSWELRGRTHPVGPPEPNQQVGNLPGYGYPIDATFLADGHGWVLQGRGDMLITADGGHTWQHSPLTRPETIAAQSADLLSDTLGLVLLRGCTVRLVRTNLTAGVATPLARWKSPTRC